VPRRTPSFPSHSGGLRPITGNSAPAEWFPEKYVGGSSTTLPHCEIRYFTTAQRELSLQQRVDGGREHRKHDGRVMRLNQPPVYDPDALKILQQAYDETCRQFGIDPHPVDGGLHKETREALASALVDLAAAGLSATRAFYARTHGTC
jgi:hypothetical protein